MAKYTEEKLLESRELAHNPKPDVLDAFNKLVEGVREHMANERKVKIANADSYIDEHGNERSYTHLNRRRLSRTGNKPNLRKKSETTVDEDGWATLVKPRKSFGEEAVDERVKFRELLKEGGAVKAKPNNKNLGSSSKPVDPRDAIADKQTTTFNAFEALGDDDE